MTEFYCPLIWKELFIENDGYVSPCLHSTNKLFDTTVLHDGQKANITNTKVNQNLDGLKHMRDQMSNGVWPKQCVNCQIKESKNLISQRQKALNSYPNFDPTVELKHLILRVGNICNLKCIMCGPWASNQWYNDYVEINDSTEFKNNQHTYQLDKKSNGDYYIKDSKLNADKWSNALEIIDSHKDKLEKISFHGGEPLVSKLHYKIINELIALNKSKNISLEYFSNFFQIPENFLDKIDQFKKVTFFISLDGVKTVNDALRWPSKFAEIENNISRMKSCNNVELKINHTVSILNCEHIIDFIEYNKDFDINLNFVTEPLYSSIKILDLKDVNNLKSVLKNKSQKIYNQYNIDKIIDSALSVNVSVENKKYHRGLYIKMWDQFSKKQDLDWKNLFPFGYRLYLDWNDQ